MKIRFIINPISGTGKQKGIELIIAQNLKEEEYDIVYTKKANDATLLSKQAIKDAITVVIAVGGDGTVNECAKALIGSNTALGVIPCGSGNGFAFHLGMKRDIQIAIEQLKHCSIKTIDSCSANGLPFVNVSGVGFDAHIANLFSNLEIRGFINYVKLITKELGYKPKKYTINYNGTERTVAAYLIAFANASQYGNDARISPLADISDGLLDFVIIKDFPKWKIPGFLLKVAQGKTHLSKYAEIIQATSMEIKTESGLVHLDGEPKELKNPITVKIHPNTLKIFTPHG